MDLFLADASITRRLLHMGREMEDGPEEPGKEHLVFMYRICDVRSFPAPRCATLLPPPTARADVTTVNNV